MSAASIPLIIAAIPEAVTAVQALGQLINSAQAAVNANPGLATQPEIQQLIADLVKAQVAHQNVQNAEPPSLPAA